MSSIGLPWNPFPFHALLIECESGYGPALSPRLPQPGSLSLPMSRTRWLAIQSLVSLVRVLPGATRR
jgi:hypothetical protein